jgi:hypothetical protein
VWINFDVGALITPKLPGYLIRKSSTDSGFSGAWRPSQKDQAMQRSYLKRQLLPNREGKKRLGQESFVRALRKLD